MPDLTAEAQRLRSRLTDRFNALFRDGAPKPGTAQARIRLRRVIRKTSRRLVRRLVAQWKRGE